MTPSKNRLIALVSILLLCLANLASAATGTLMPTPFQVLLDANGNPVSNGKVCTYVAGTSTPATTYTDVNLSVANANPIRTDTAGRFVVYLTPGASYKFVYQDSSGTAGTCDGASIKTQDNVAAVPTSSANLDITGTAGEALTAGQVVYLSDGSGSKVAGQWYKADSANGYSSTLPEIGMAPASISSGVAGTIRIAGQVTGLTVSVGQGYYVGTAGAITVTAPVQARKIGVADSATTLVLKDIAAPAQNWVNDFRLTLTTATPITTADVTAATTIYASPLAGNRLDLPDSAGNPSRLVCAEFSIAVPASTSQMYDLWAYNNSGACALEALAWTNDTTRATAIIRTTTGRYYKTGDLTRMYVGSFRTTTVSGQTEDSLTKRYLWNYYNRVRRPMLRQESTTTWTYTSGTIRQANAAPANQLDIVNGVNEWMAEATIQVSAGHNTAGGIISIGVGLDSTSTYVGEPIAAQAQVANNPFWLGARYRGYIGVGRHVLSWNESAGGATTTFYAAGGAGSTTNGTAGITAVIEG